MHHAYLRSHTSRARRRERARRGFRKLRGPYLCKCPRARVALRAAFPARRCAGLEFASLRPGLPLHTFARRKKILARRRGRNFATGRNLLASDSEREKPEQKRGPPSERIISVSRRTSVSSVLYARRKRFTSNLFLSFRGNRSPMTSSLSFLCSRSPMLGNPPLRFSNRAPRSRKSRGPRFSPRFNP